MVRWLLLLIIMIIISIIMMIIITMPLGLGSLAPELLRGRRQHADEGGHLPSLGSEGTYQ